MNTNTNENAVEVQGYTVTAARRTRTTSTGRVVTDRDVSVLPEIKRYRIDAGRSYTSKGEWTTNYQVFVKLAKGDDHSWRSSANVATQYGISMPLAYATKEKAADAAKKILATWGKPVVKAEKKKDPTKDQIKAELDAAKAELAEAKRQLELAKAAKAA